MNQRATKYRRRTALFGAPFTNPNEAYFAHADYAVASAAEKGIALLLDPFYIGARCGDEGWCAEIQSATTTDLANWGHYVGDRYKSFDNIVWVIGGDIDPSTVPGLADRVETFVTALQQSDNRHLITVHNNRGTMGRTPWPFATWLTVNNTYTSYESSYQQAQLAYELRPRHRFFKSRLSTRTSTR